MMIRIKNNERQYVVSILLCVWLFAVYFYNFDPSIGTATARVVLFGSVQQQATTTTTTTFGSNSNDEALYSSNNDILYDTTNEQQQHQHQRTNVFGRLASQLSNKYNSFVDQQKLVAVTNTYNDKTIIERKTIINVFNPLRLLRINNKLSAYMKQVLQVHGGSKEKEKSSSGGGSNTQTLSLSLRDAMIDNDDRNNKQKEYPIAVVPETIVHDSTDIDKFFDLFLKTNSKYSIFDKFLQTQGDTKIVVEDWVKSDSSNNNHKQLEKSIMKRTVHYIHPVSVPMAPPTAATRREQTIVHHYYPNKQNPKKKQLYGISIESKTYVDGVPMADCFYSAERVIITASSPLFDDSNNDSTVPKNGLSISVDFGLTFIKKSMFKSIITKSTSNTVSELYKDMIKYIQVSLAKEM